MWIEKTSNGKYKVSERYIDPITGKSRKVSINMEKNTASSRKDAMEILMGKIREKMDEDKPLEKITLSELVDAYLADQKITVTKSTWKRNYFAMGTIVKMLGGQTLVSKLSAHYIRKQLTASGKKPSTLNEHLVRIHALIMWGYKNDMVADIAFMNKLEPFKAPPHKEVIKDKYMESDELRLVLDGMTVPVWCLLTEFLALSGLRIGEAIALERSDVDLDARQIHVTKAYDSVNKELSSAKTLCSIRDVRIQPELLEVVRKINTLMKEQALFCGLPRQKLFLFNSKGDYIQYYSYNKYLGEHTLEALGRKLTPHSLRHTHASFLMEQGVPIDVISRRLGHEGSRITKEIYLHVTKKLKEKDDMIFDRTKIL